MTNPKFYNASFFVMLTLVTSCSKVDFDLRKKNMTSSISEDQVQKTGSNEDIIASQPPLELNSFTINSEKSYLPIETFDWESIDSLVIKDRNGNGDAASSTAYTFIPQNFATDQDAMNLARIGLVKALNSVAINSDSIVNFKDITGHGVLFSFNLEDFLGNSYVQKWQWICAGEPVALGGGGFQDLAPALNLSPIDCSKAIQADRLAYNVTHGGIYAALIDTPPRRGDLNTNLGLSNDRAATFAVENGITLGIRYGERRSFPISSSQGNKKGIYWVTFDPFDPGEGIDDKLPWTNAGSIIPNFNSFGQIVDFQSNVAAEGYHSMKNGLFAYYIWGSNDQRRSRADPRFVGDPLHQSVQGSTGELVTGFCAHCHINGVQGAFSDMADYTSKNPGVDNTNFWSSNAKLQSYWNDDRKDYFTAMKSIVIGISGHSSGGFNYNVVYGLDPREPMYFLNKFIEGHDGDTSWLRRRNNDGQIAGMTSSFTAIETDKKLDNLTFQNDILPIFQKYGCVSCHQVLSDEKKISPGYLAESIRRSNEKSMPPITYKQHLSESEISLLIEWGKSRE